MINLRDFTTKQIFLACGLARGIKRKTLVNDIKVEDSYITKMMKKEDFVTLINMFKTLPPDNDTKIYEGEKTLMMEAGRMFYNIGSKL